MKCLIKIHHPRLIYVFLFAVFSLFLSAVGSVSDSYAISGTCTLEFSLNSQYAPSGKFSSDCVNGWQSGWYIRPVSFSFNITPTNTAPNYFYIYAGYSNRLTLFQLNYIPLSVSDYDISDYTKFTLINFYRQITYPNSSPSTSSWSQLNVGFNQSVSGTVSVTYEYTDSFGVSSCPEPEPCPPIPENPYDDKLDEIKTAIYCASAVMIMIYFFFIVYKIIVKDGGRR